MILTTSNILSSYTPTIETGASTDDSNNIVNQDFSLNYTSSHATTLTISFGAVSAIDYIAVSGIIVKGDGSGSSIVQIQDGTTLINSVNLLRDRTCVFNFTRRSFANLKVKLINATGDIKPTVSYIAAGDALIVPNFGEVGGHERAWLGRYNKNKLSTNSIAAPISALRDFTPISISLNMPNLLTSFCRIEMQRFLDFAESNLFFINEDQAAPESSYVCYELNSAEFTAHSETRALNNCKMSFKAFTR